MTQPDSNAFTMPDTSSRFGLTIREHFAIQCMQGLLACAPDHATNCDPGTLPHVAALAVRAADELIAALNRRSQ